MRSLSALLALSASWPVVTAFYPYHFGDGDGTTPSRRSARLPEQDGGSITLPFRTRQNTYKILESKDPSYENSVAIDQDGGDLSYMVAVRIGDSKEEYHLLLDSAASNTWVMGQDCQSDACKTHNTFGAADSSSLKTQTTPFSVTYGTGSVSGTLATDTLHISSLSPAFTFGVANNVSAEFSSYPMDGILGLGRGTLSSTPSLLTTLRSTSLLDSPTIAIHLPRAPSTDGELTLGGANPARHNGLTWHPALPSTNGFWELSLSSATIGSTSLPLASRTAIIDTGTSYLLLPPSDAAALHALIPASTQSPPDSGTYSVPCDTATSLSLSFDGKTQFPIASADWVGGRQDSGLCASKIVGRQTFGDKQWLVGDVFLKNVYVVFEAEGEGRVGFGVSGGSSSPSSSSSTSASTGTSTGTAMASASSTATNVAGSSSSPANAEQTAALEAGPLPSGSAASQAAGGAQGGVGRVVCRPVLVVLVWCSSVGLFFVHG